MIQFGTGGWRAIIADGFTKGNVRLLCQGLAEQMKQENVIEPGIIIGYDRRFLSREAAEWAAEVLAGNQIQCQLIQPDAPTPLIMFTVKKLGTAYGLAVTASHNPAVYNGIKLFTAGGRDADVSVTDKLEQLVNSISPADVRSIPIEEAERTGLVTRINPFNMYIDTIIASVNMDAIRGRGLKVALDPMFGVSRTSLQTILMTARCEVEVIHERRDTLFGGRLPSPNVQTLNALKQVVLEHRCDLGIATDGDADRLGIIDDQGAFLHPNQILVILYYYLLSYKGWRGPCVRNLATTHLLDRVASHFGEQCHEVPVGFKHISAKMQETSAVIGGESSGGLTVRGHIPGKDGIYAATLLVEMLAVTGRSLSALYKEITSQFGELFMTEHDYRFSEASKKAIQKQLLQEQQLPEFSEPVANISWIDGCKVYFQNGGWAIARFSGTEALLRIFCEMPDLQLAEDITKQWARHLGLKD
ncbi:MAG: phosphoglucomutase/phosphomannomutase family protein [Clostridiaceae bacterium]|jgi:alpha-D-glucose phosphate-specific phosphoglucomutase|nr:phosphoglucomutase/phosphomannomutase family protein [Eubacteriales bacterium]NLV47332.1 phosphoglucomutase/phosphomannomutase family protein [Clostridiaceae bacterium]